MSRGVLVDTSVWVDHFRHRNVPLMGLLELDLVLIHPLIVGEIACGTPPNRSRTLVDLDGLRHTQQASIRETMTFVDREPLFGRGCGIVDLLLLASALITPGALLWTHDQRLAALAARFGILYTPTPH